MKRVFLIIAACFLIILGCKKTFEQNDDKDAKSLLVDYSATYKRSDTASAKLTNPRLLNFNAAKEVNIKNIGPGYLIPLNKQQLPDVSTAGHLSFFAFYSSSKQSIYQVFAQIPSGNLTVDHLVENIIEVHDTGLSYCVLNGNGLPVILYAPSGGMPVLQKTSLVKRLAIGKDPNHKAVNTMSNCSEENTYTIVRYYYNTETGAIISAQVIGEICLDSDPFEPSTGVSSDNQVQIHRTLMKSNSCLDSAQDRKFGQTVSTWYNDHCMSKALYNYITENHIQMTVCTDSTGNGWTSGVDGAYNPTANTLNIRNSQLTNAAVLKEELFHAVQNNAYTGGTAQYAATANGNIEFEYRFVYFAIGYDPNPFDYDQTLKAQFETYVNAITLNKTSLPTESVHMDLPGFYTYNYFAEKYTDHLNAITNSKFYHFSNFIDPELVPVLGNKYLPGCN